MSLHIVERGGRLWIQGRLRGELYRKSTGLPIGKEAIAEEMADDMTRQVLLGTYVKPDRVSWDELARDYLTRPEGASERARYYVEKVLTPHLKGKAVANIDMEAFVRKAFYDGDAPRVEPSTIRRALVQARAVFNLAVKNGKLTAGPRFRMPVGYNARTRFLTIEEARTLVDACRRAAPWFEPLLVFLLDTGARLNEAVLLTWDRVEIEGANGTRKGRVTFTTRKGRPARERRRVVPLTRRTIEMLEAERAKRLPAGGDRVFINGKGAPWAYPCPNVYYIWNIVCGEAGIGGVVVHDLRRTFASHLVMKSVNLLTVAKLLGHTNLKMLQQHYGHLSPDHLQDTVDLLPWG